MMASDAAKSMEPDIAKTKAWKIGLFVILIIFSLFITGTSILNSQSGKQGDFKMEQADCRNTIHKWSYL